MSGVSADDREELEQDILAYTKLKDFLRKWYMCPWAHFRAYGKEINNRSCLRWCIGELSYKSPPAAT